MAARFKHYFGDHAEAHREARTAALALRDLGRGGGQDGTEVFIEWFRMQAEDFAAEVRSAP